MSMQTDNSNFCETEKGVIVFHNKDEIPCITIPHLHSQYEIYYNISGAKGLMIGGEVYGCGRYNLALIPRVQTHKVIVKKNEPYERCIINIDSRTVTLTETLCNHSCTEWIHNDALMVDLSPDEHNVFMSLIDGYNAAEKAEDKLLLFSKFLEIMSFLGNMFKKPPVKKPLEEKMISYTDLILRCIEHNFQKIKVGEIAEDLHLNEDHMNRVFKEETGITIKHYLTLRKIAEAKKHLYTGKSVKEACRMSGFGNYANFLRTFKKYEGYSPGKLKELTQPL